MTPPAATARRHGALIRLQPRLRCLDEDLKLGIETLARVHKIA
jgi:hypothetical protein